MKGKSLISPVSLTDQVADFITMSVANGELPAGSKVGERQLCDSLKVSRVPVREAMKLLQAQGLLHGEPNRGVFVNAQSLEETLEMLEVRATIELIAIRRIQNDPERRGSAEATLSDSVDELRKQAYIKDFTNYCLADLSFHQCLVELSESSILLTLWQSISRNVLVFLLNERSGDFDFEGSIEDHNRLIRKIFSNDAEIENELKQHLIGYIQHTRNQDRAKEYSDEKE